MDMFLIFFGATFVTNIVLVQFLGICPFLGISSRLTTSVGMGMAVIFVMTLSTVAAYLIQTLILEPFGIEFMQYVAFILVISSLVQLVETVLKKVSPPLYDALGVFLPLITTNCAILGVALLIVYQSLNLAESFIFAVGSSIGFMIAIVLMAAIRERLALVDVPQAMKGGPITLVTAGLLALAFMGFTGMV